MQLGDDFDGVFKNEYLGHAVALNDDGSIFAVVSEKSRFGNKRSGHVRVHMWDGAANAWVRRGQDLEGEAHKDFISSVALSADGSVVAWGAYANDGSGKDAGHARI